MKKYLIVAALALALTAVDLSAQVTVAFTATGNLPRNDDNYAGAIDLGFSLNFYGTTYSQVYVSNNGYVTFGSGQGNYTPQGLGQGYSGLPIIAAFFSDVDTRNTATNIVEWGTTTFQNHEAFAASWPGVGEYSYGAILNDFQLLLVERSDTGAGNFDIYFNYNVINWDHGRAAVGYNNGLTNAPVYYQLAGSLVQGAFLNGGPNALVSNSNINPNDPAYALGRYLFQARNGTFIPPPDAIPEPSTYALLALGLGALGISGFCRRRAGAKS